MIFEDKRKTNELIIIKSNTKEYNGCKCFLYFSSKLSFVSHQTSVLQCDKTHLNEGELAVLVLFFSLNH